MRRRGSDLGLMSGVLARSGIDLVERTRPQSIQQELVIPSEDIVSHRSARKPVVVVDSNKNDSVNDNGGASGVKSEGTLVCLGVYIDSYIEDNVSIRCLHLPIFFHS